jgi:hypothetical protein
VREVVDPYLRDGIGICQMPCRNSSPGTGAEAGWLYSVPAGYSRASGPPACSSPDPAEITTQLPGAMTRVTAAAMPQAVAVPGQPGQGPAQAQPVLPGSQRKQREQLCPDLIIAPARTEAPEPKLVRPGGTWS